MQNWTTDLTVLIMPAIALTIGWWGNFMREFALYSWGDEDLGTTEQDF
jgi:hypothetical protein